MQKLNPHISVDCVVFGFDGLHIRILLIERVLSDKNGKEKTDLKLPGDFIRNDEDLQVAAVRVLSELTGLENIFLRQFSVFGSPDRINKKRDLEWLRTTTGLGIDRVVTIAYYSLIKIDESKEELVRKNKGAWLTLASFSELAFDHYEIVREALESLREKIMHEPVGFELLPKKFTLRQLQNLYEAILGEKLDNRNFRKKILKSGYLLPLDEKQTAVAHKPARMFRFERRKSRELGVGSRE